MNFTNGYVRSSASVKNFLENRAEFEENGSALTILEALFGSLHYNVSVSEEFDSTREVIENYMDFSYKSILKQLFDSKIGNIIGLTKEFQAQQGSLMAQPFQTKGKYTNTFFVVGDKFVPSSFIVQEIINYLKGGDTDSLVKSSYQVLDTNAGHFVYPSSMHRSKNTEQLANLKRNSKTQARRNELQESTPPSFDETLEKIHLAYTINLNIQ